VTLLAAQPAILPILRHGDPRLRRSCCEVAPDEAIADLVAAMQHTMLTAGGVGLAAPQVGDERRIIVCLDPDRPGAAPLVLINPTLERTGGPRVSFKEGCLSFPDLFLRLWRPRDVRVCYRDLAGRERVRDFSSVLARIILHEIDHLDGVLFIDHLPGWRRWLLGRRLRRLHRQGGKAAV
jgi:peptide deformylase